MSQFSFQFEALDRHGERTRGVVSALSRKDAYRQVCAIGLQPTRLRALHGLGANLTSRFRRRIRTCDLAHFTHQFAVLTQARIPIVDALTAVAEQEPNPRLSAALHDIAGNVASGSNLSEALAAHRAVFGEVYVETIRAAERTGNVNEALESLSETLDREHEMRKQFRGALMYPACVLAWVFIAVSFLLIAVVPRFSALFAARGGELPLPTRVLIAGSEFLAGWWFVILGVAAIAGWLVYWGWTTGRFKPHIDRFLHALPVVREILRGAAVARFAQVLGLSLRSGLGLIEALELAGRASARPLLIADANRMAEQVKHGGRLADVLIACRYLPPIARRMLTAGEEAAELPRMCAVISDHCEREVAHLARNVTDLIEPLLIVVLAALVLLVALAIFLPMWNMAALL